MRKWLISAVSTFVVFMCFYLACVHYTEAYQVGISWNRFTGELKRDDTAGVHITPPWVQVSRIDTRPVRVCMTSASRGFNCKLVQFMPDDFKEFVSVQGFYYWWWANRISVNFGYNEEYRGMKDLLRGYTFSVKQYPFVKVLRDYQE